MSLDPNVHLIDGPHEEHQATWDGVAYIWFIGPHRVEVRITGTAIAVGAEGLSDRAARALETKGESEIEEFLKWKEPPEEIEFSTDNWPWVSGGIVE